MPGEIRLGYTLKRHQTPICIAVTVAELLPNTGLEPVIDELDGHVNAVCPVACTVVSK
jgi:hypothetical protein